MKKSVFNVRQRRGFTLVEVALAAVIGSLLLTSLIYTSRTMSRAVSAVYNEAMLQTVFRDLQNDLDSNIYRGLDGATDDNAYTGGSAPFQFTANALTIKHATSAAKNFRLQYQPGAMTGSNPGGSLKWSTNNGTTWQSMIGLGSRGLLAGVAFNYSTYATPISVPSGAISFTYDSRVNNNLVKIDAVLNKTEMVPFLLQSAYAPRATSWKWITYSKQGITPPPGNDGGNFYPMALKRTQIDYTKPFDIFTGAGSGHFGWLTWDGSQSQGTLAESLADPNSHQYVNPDDPDDRAVSLFDWINGKVGVVNSSAVRDALANLVGKEIDVIAWDNSIGSGSNTYIQASGFAKVKITSYDLPGKTITAMFLGWVDEEGNLLPPSIINFNPVAGAVGRTVQVTGMNFNADPNQNAVAINGVPATVTAAATNSLVIVVPAGATTGAITVETNGEVATSGMHFHVLPPPVITGFSPTSGGPGAQVTINGQNFDTTPSANTVLFNGIRAVVNSGDANHLVVTVPPGASTGQISVTCSDNQLTLSADTFTVPPPPTITGFSPATAAVGQTVTIDGTNFDPAASGNVVRFNGVQAVVSTATATQLHVVVPAGATTGPIQVTAFSLSNNTSTNFTVRPAPVITGFSPASGGADTEVTLTGTNFDPSPTENVLKLNGKPMTVVSASATQIKARVAAGSSTGPISLSIGAHTITTGSNFTYMVAPTVSGFSPLFGYVSQQITITGANFDPTAGNNVVKFHDGVTATVVSATPTQLVVQVPAGAIDGPISVSVWGLKAESVGSFNVTTSPAPAISSFSPASAYTGQVVTIHGTNFAGTPADNSVRFNGALATIVTAAPNQLTVLVPAGATTGPLQVTVAGLTGNSPTPFTFIPPPSIIDFSPAATSINEQVVIQGTHFDNTPGNNVVKFNGTSATVVSASETQLVVNVPPGATTGKISVQTNGQIVTSSSNFTVTLVPAPVITGFNPSGTYVGQSVTLTGRNFVSPASDNLVKFNGVTAAVTGGNGTSLTVTVPAGATTGRLTVTNNGLTATSSTNFVVTAAPMPTVTGFSPGSGLAGATVTVTGTNFASPATANVVKFNGVAATVTGGNGTSLTVTVPAGATTGPISVTANGNTATSATSFVVIPPSNRLLPIALNHDLVAGKAGNTDLGSIYYGLGSGQFAWLSWTSNVSEATWLAAMSPGAPTSSSYVNPLAPGDTHVDVGDAINVVQDITNNTTGKAGVDNLVSAGNIIVPLFNGASLSSTPQRVTVSGFALIKVTARANNYNGQDNFKATFIRLCDCDGN